MTPIKRRRDLIENFKQQEQCNEFRPIKRFNNNEAIKAYALALLNERKNEWTNYTQAESN